MTDQLKSQLIKIHLIKIRALILLLVSQPLYSEPWIDTRDAWLRSDLEVLSDIGVIQVPITTYPLIWSGIIKDLDNSNIENVAKEYKSVYWRVKKLARRAILKTSQQQLKFSVASSEQVLRGFGDNSRSGVEISARRFGLNNTFAWNIEVSRVLDDPQDGENTRYDHTYLAVVLSNWVVAVGQIEKWWGPSWNSANLLSNNARPPLGVSLQRNYSDSSDNIFFSWLGNWTFNTFIAELDDPRLIKNTKLTGASFNFKPFSGLEIGLRATSLWGGSGQQETTTGFIDNLIANGSCDLALQTDPLSQCGEFYTDSGDRIAGIDFRLRLPIGQPISLYASAYGESETQLIPSKQITQIGLTGSFVQFDTHWKWFAEISDTTLNKKEFNTAYESTIYQTGYRYNQRAIGSTYDNDSMVSSIGLLSNFNKQNKISLVLSQVELNTDSQNRIDSSTNTLGIHTITALKKEFKRVKLNWHYQTYSNGVIKLSIDYSDKLFDEFDRLNDNYRIAIDWEYGI